MNCHQISDENTDIGILPANSPREALENYLRSQITVTDDDEVAEIQLYGNTIKATLA